jgi:hypothetical protein
MRVHAAEDITPRDESPPIDSRPFQNPTSDRKARKSKTMCRIPMSCREKCPPPYVKLAEILCRVRSRTCMSRKRWIRSSEMWLQMWLQMWLHLHEQEAVDPLLGDQLLNLVDFRAQPPRQFGEARECEVELRGGGLQMWLQMWLVRECEVELRACGYRCGYRCG